MPWDPAAIDLQQRLLPPGAAHWLGTDHLGRDIFSRLLAATRVSLGAVMACLLLVLLIGLAVGGCAGLLGGRTDRGLMRIAELFMTFPTSILSFFMVGVLGTGLTNVILAIALSHWAWYARMVRNLVVSLRQREFILAARLRRRQPVAAVQRPSGRRGDPSLLVLASLDIGHMMLHVAGMSFLGLGVSAPTAEWGVMINDARQYIWTQPLQMVWPGLALFISVMAFNLLGDALRDRLDPHLIAEHSH
ncbi:nickel ABC transporter permease NikC [Klebsiella aerogenes]|nr:nickel ABC transporter permease NikC [Klebsiella aerogenes]